MRESGIRQMFYLLPAVCMIVAGCTTTLGQYAENVATVPWLPKEATNISYRRTPSFTAYEFNISEQGFLKWAQPKWAVKKTDRMVSLWTYKAKGLDSTGSDDETAMDVEAMMEADVKAGRLAVITKGYHFSESFKQGGGMAVAYDTAKKRAYFYSLQPNWAK